MQQSIKDFENYLIDEEGQIFSLLSHKFLKHNIKKDGYHEVSLYKDGKKITKKVHRLVAECFLPNPNNYPEVNHKDENKDNNTLNNLEWCDGKYNTNYGTGNQRRSSAMDNKKVCVKQYDLEGNFIKEYLSMKEALKDKQEFQQVQLVRFAPNKENLQEDTFGLKKCKIGYISI